MDPNNFWQSIMDSVNTGNNGNAHLDPTADAGTWGTGSQDFTTRPSYGGNAPGQYNTMPVQGDQYGQGGYQGAGGGFGNQTPYPDFNSGNGQNPWQPSNQLKGSVLLDQVYPNVPGYHGVDNGNQWNQGNLNQYFPTLPKAPAQGSGSPLDNPNYINQPSQDAAQRAAYGGNGKPDLGQGPFGAYIPWQAFQKNVYGEQNAQRQFNELAGNLSGQRLQDALGLHGWNYAGGQPNDQFGSYYNGGQQNALAQANALSQTNPNFDYSVANVNGAAQILQRSNQAGGGQPYTGYLPPPPQANPVAASRPGYAPVSRGYSGGGNAYGNAAGGAVGRPGTTFSTPVNTAGETINQARDPSGPAYAAWLDPWSGNYPKPAGLLGDQNPNPRDARVVQPTIPTSTFEPPVGLSNSLPSGGTTIAPPSYTPYEAPPNPYWSYLQQRIANAEANSGTIRRGSQ